ncbi:presilphiperfolan-8-beta-ol synthase [Fusarium tjaetaba]|uniref:Terpene synthase n=1 Tax=Fusarium tjaetaba TaxID=1567544 RepID=A0A8H5RX46_9HYPO|nr:presilphiperfolan-8-beta-ol synthase [Fusarium tjaetaba]KAF5639771.1 presilphiperfolan-8-beta-ol synthase [Fusarium tjaetaba]
MESKRTVILPDMFKAFVVETPPMNPNYETVKPISERWLAEKCSFSPRMKKRVEFCDFAVFISIAAPDAPFDKLKTMCDWGNWVFPFDDKYAHDINLTDEVFQNPIIQRLELLGADFVLLSNDILSYRKEENDDCPFSMVAACRMSGQSPQEAFDTVGNLLEARYQDWQNAIKQLPSWGPEIDANVARYIQGIQNVVQANITWRYQILLKCETD